MEGDEARRFCGKCEKYVYDFAALTAVEARNLLIASEGRVCARIFTRADGTVLTRDCPVGISRRRAKKIAGVAAAATALLGTAAASGSVPATCYVPVLKSLNSKCMMLGRPELIPPIKAVL